MNMSKFLSIVLTKFTKDELSAAALYIRLAQVTTNPTIHKELLEHANEEFTHYKQLVIFAANRDIPITVQLDKDLVNTSTSTNSEILALVQGLERDAIKNYTRLARIALKVKDIEMFDLFKSLMKDELRHYDDLNIFQGVPRST